MADFLLILRGDASADLTDHSPTALAELLAAYQQWATSLGPRLRAAEKAWPRGARVVGPDGAAAEGPHGDGADVVSGFYVVSADDLDHATRLCAGHPCLRTGSIEVRELQPTEPCSTAPRAQDASS
ncbi:MAG: YciI family protein [Planctomycetota bacterium]